MSLYRRNIELLKNKFPYIEFDEQAEEQNEEKVFWEESFSNENIVGTYVDGTPLLLNSKYEAELWANKWVDQFEKVTYNTVFILLGIANGMYLKALHDKYPNNKIICCEIYPFLEQNILHKLDFAEFIHDNIFIIFGKNRFQIYQDYLAVMVSYSNYRGVEFCSIPNYSVVNSDIYTLYLNTFYNRVEKVILARNTLIGDEKCRRDSYLHNLFFFPKVNDIGQLVYQFNAIDISDRPAIIVAAGPSLDKNIEVLRKAKGKALLITVDAAAKSMVKKGILPDLVVSIDPIKDEGVLGEEQLLKCALVPSLFSHYKIVEQHRGCVFFQTGESEFGRYIYEKYGKEMYALPSGGSVANSAFSLAEILGFKTIILVGQDLSYPDGKVHASSAIYQNCLDNQIDEKSSRYFYVEANDGGSVLTEYNMNAYRKWFEEQAAKNEIKIVNATEGGAKIRGTEVMTLEEALKKYCIAKEEISFEEIVRIEETSFAKKQQEEIFEYYLGIEKEIDVWERRLSSGIELYKRLKILNINGKVSTHEYNKIVSEVGEITKELNNSEVVDLLNQWGNREEYEVLDMISEEFEDTYQERNAIIDSGIKMYETYIDNCKLLKKYWNHLIDENDLRK